MTMMSVCSTTSRLSGEASTSMGKQVAGRRLANRSSSLRRPRRPRSGRFSWGRLSHLGPPTEPNRMASLRSQRARVAGGRGSPVPSIAAPPMRAGSNSKATPVARPTTSSTLRASGVTSCPMPSPPRIAILCVAIRQASGSCLLSPPCARSRALLRHLHLLRAQAHPHEAPRAAQQVEGEEDEEEPLRMGGDNEHAENHEHQHLGGPAAREVDLLEAVVAKGRDHEEGDDHRAHRDGRGQPAGHHHPLQEEGGRSDDARGGGGGQSHEVPAIRHTLIDVEAGETQGAADHEEEGAEPGDPSRLGEGQRVQHEGGRHAEGHRVGQRVELHAELGGGPGEASDLAVEDVQDHAHEHRHRPLYEAGLRGQHDGEETAEQISGGKQAREEEDAATRMLAQLLPPATTRMPGPLPTRMPTSHRSTPMTVSPPLTRSPTFTRISADRGTSRSVRDPKRISPKRSPAASLSPRSTRQTMRRASTPAICFTLTRAPSPWSATVHRSFSSDASSL